ncbi:MAG: hypothetical protein IJN34_08450 [Clostridia bacterium]|nr:hypothetical protein [Clostridia bacterium]
MVFFKKGWLVLGSFFLAGLVLIGAYLLLDHVFVRQIGFATFPAMTAEEQIEKAHLIVKGTFEDKSKAFRFSSSNFTDYDLTVEEVYRGDAAAGDVLSVRVEEGLVGTLWVETVHEPKIRLGDTVFVYLYQTGGDYYYVLNGKSGYYLFDGEGKIKNSESGEVLGLAEVEDTIKKVYEREQKSKENSANSLSK